MSNIVLGIRLTADGKDLVGVVKVSADEIDKLGASTKRASSEAQRLNEAQKGLAGTSAALTNALRGVVGAFGLAQLISLTDQYTKFNAQLKLASLSQSEYVQSLSDVRRIATLAQSSLGETGILYARITNAVRELGIAQRDVADITETISLALKASGATATESASAMLQLSQAFGSGVLRGEEFNAVNEAAPRLMRALADGIGVPVGRLREMAEAGKLTSEVMANALPRALSDLRKEAASVQTIAGAFQVLKNNVMEFVGGGAQANGAAQALASSIGLLAENLALLAGVALTVAASKLAQWAVASAAAMYSNVAASRAAALATLDAARADVVATGSAATLTAARLAELRAVVIAAEGNVALAITTNGLVPAQAAATAASAAHTAALSALTVAQRGASIAATAGSAALAFLGGPIGAVTVALGLAATAWAVWGRSARDANAQAKDSTVTTSDEILAALEVQNNKLRERIALSKAGNADAAREGGPAAEKLASTLNEINALKAKGSELTLVDRITLIDLEGRYNEISVALRENKVLTGEIAAIGQRSKAAQWAEEYATKAEKLTSTLAKARAELGAAFSPELEKRIRDKFAEKAPPAGSGADKNLAAYNALIKSIEEKTALDALEAQGVQKLSDAEKLAAKTMVELREGTLKLTDAQKRNLAGKLEGLIAADKFNTQEAAAFAARAKAEKEYEDLQTKNAAFLETLERAKTEALVSAKKNIEQIEFETTLVGKSNAERETAIALRALETSGIDKQSSAYADLRERMETALSSRAAAQAVQDQVDKAKEAQKRMDEDLRRGLTDSIFRGFEAGKGFAKNFFDSLKNLAKTTVLRPVIEWALSPVSRAIGATLGGMGIPGMANAAGAAAGGGILGSIGSSVMGMGGGFAELGSGLVLAANEGILTGAMQGMSMLGSGSALAGIGAMLPVFGIAAAAAGALGLFSGDGDAQRTGNWSAALGQPGRSTENRWFDSSTGAGSFAADLAASEQKIADTLKLSSEQLAAVNAALALRSGTQYNFGMEHTDWTQSGAAQAIQADRLKAIAEALGTSVEGLAQKMTEAQTVIDLAPKKRELEIQLMEAQGKTVEALAAKREDEIAALDATLRPLQLQIYAAEDMATAANDASDALERAASAQRDMTAAVVDGLEASVRQGQSIRDFLLSLGAAGPQLTLENARAAYDADLAAARAGNAEAYSRITGSASNLIQAGQAMWASGADQVDLVAQIKSELESLAPAQALDENLVLLRAIRDNTHDMAFSGVKALFDVQSTISLIADSSGMSAEDKALALMQSQEVEKSIRAAFAGGDEDAITLALSQTAEFVATVKAQISGDAATTEAVALLKKQQWDEAFQAEAARLYTPEMQAAHSIQVPYEYYDENTDEMATGYKAKFDLAWYDAEIAAWKAANPMPAYAEGGIASGWSLVGERGPELVDFRSPGRVYTADETRGMFGGAANDDMVAELKALRAEVARLTAVVAEGDAANVRATAASGDKSARAVSEAAWRDEIRPKAA